MPDLSAMSQSMSGDFIEVYENALDPAICATLIRRFEACGEAVRGSTGGGVDIKLKDSWDIAISGRPAWADAERALNAAMMAGLKNYLRKYPYTLLAPLSLRIPDAADGAATLLDAERLSALPDEMLQALIRKTLRPGSINLQKYISDQGGYPYWHCELYPKANDAQGETLHRTLLWTIYLNEGFTDGETEFLHQRRKIVPKTGTLLIAPTAFTHTHRGNMPKGENKYIATSWILFQRAEKIYGVK
jgi:2-oxoglutarate-Fe(II)-dependent oxygenase superfamily protein